MTWFKVDDGLHSHNKPRCAGLAAMGLWTVAGSLAGHQLSDGHVPVWYVESWPGGRKLARQLVAAGLWHETGHDCPECPQPLDGGWVFHDFHQANPRREEELDKKAKRAAAGRRGGLASGASRAAGSSTGEANAGASGEANASASVEPRPDPSIPKNKTLASGSADREPKAPQKPRPPDPVWDALIGVCGIDPDSITKSARGGYNKAVADLTAVSATPAEISRRARQFRRQWPNVSLTPPALARHWSELSTASPGNGSSPPPARDALANIDAQVERERASERQASDRHRMPGVTEMAFGAMPA